MAYLARIEPAEGPALPVPLARAQQAEPVVQFTELEWSIIRLAKLDGLWTLRPSTRLNRLLRRLQGRNPNPQLASERLEAIRRMAVLSWHFGFTVDGFDVAEFLQAGFSLEQYELLVMTILGANSNVVPLSAAGRA